MKNIARIFVCLLFVLPSFAQDKSAKDLIESGLKETAWQKKKLLLVFTSSWCGWCFDFKKIITDTAENKLGKLFSRNYIVKYLNVFETGGQRHREYPDATEIFKTYANQNNHTTLPFYVILNGNGHLVGDSYYQIDGITNIQKGNIGKPHIEKEMLAFLHLLKKTSDMNATELKRVATEFNSSLKWEDLRAKLSKK